jgi:hypothetical protein
MAECPNCEKQVVASACPTCGWKVPAAPGAPSRDSKPPKEENAFDYCGWTTEGRTCLLLATTWTSPYGTRDTSGTTVRKGYCHWHVMCLETPGLADAFDEFEAWREWLLGHRVCTQFSHHPASYVWRAMQGIGIMDPAERRLVERCQAPDCWAPEVLRRHYVKLDRDKQREEEAQRIVPAAEAAVRLREIERALVTQMTFPNSTSDEQENIA